MRCVQADRAVGCIVFIDILSGLLIVTLVKALAANNFLTDIRHFRRYIRRRFCSIVVELVIFVSALIVLVNIVAWKHFPRDKALLYLMPFSVLGLLFFIVEFHI